MKTEDLEIIKSSQLETLSISVTEEIQAKYLEDFLKTNILNSKILLSPNTQYYYQYIKQTLTYELIVFDTDHQNFLVEPFILLENRKKEQENKNILYLLENYFVLVKNNKLLLFKLIEDIEKDEVLNYLKSSYEVVVDEIISINHRELEERKVEILNDKKRKLPQVRFHFLYPKKGYLYFKFFTLFITVLFCFALVLENLTQSSIKKKPSELLSLEKKYQYLAETYKGNNKKAVTVLFEIFKKVSFEKISIEYIEYENNMMKLSLLHHNKSVLLDFLETQRKASINTLEYKEKDKVFKMEIIIEI